MYLPALQEPPKVTVSGSFRKNMLGVQRAVYDLTDAGAVVLSPADPRVVDRFGDFLFVASDMNRSIRFTQNRHLAAIEQSVFVWLEIDDGYVGQSAAMELGFACALGVPVYSSGVPEDLTLRQYVRIVPSVRSALADALRSSGSVTRAASVLLSPDSALDRAHDHLETIRDSLVTANDSQGIEAKQAAERIRQELRFVS